MLTQEYISGFVNAQGSFLEYRRNKNPCFAFQIKSSISNKPLLDQIAATIGLYNKVYCYSNSKQSYALLVVRDRQSILELIIPFFDNRLFGDKAESFDKWKQSILAKRSTWNYRNIKGQINPQSYKYVDKKPNNYLNK